ncbi:phenylacetic acid degradation operon negative regulatory protein PaaX [Acinetobacter brisouii CIP 110357]|uniref:Phenylacetic acid degradation operon negative regulatory protein PaaX n=1 Tax=Acinetobacter brisouii CIP 110357 TaxID=1341683 RepID=V2ULL8_9GAMM|nr:phenylacetic acid degradation operon negative regulatory protein PaaX [Acinetobacter brisouii]ENV46118.1 phenylacetic acid degradation operon negative regulatory protein PaaX [Acinetobacter brisouii ANC 4119]ESK50857.1 phenylacetic acid degradation operon negative regulatory protein PaaX [Acinetobacter brisouii CIP 110357]
MSVRIQHIIQYLIEQEPLSATSLVSSIYGDSILHRGGNISLASLIQLIEPFGFNDRAVRTAVFRLVKNEWLDSQKVGRTSFYRITDASRKVYLQAEQRIYNHQMREWDRYWDLILLSSVEMENKITLKKELEWLGFSSIATNLMAYPGCDQAKLQKLLIELNMMDQVVVFKAQTLDLWAGSSDTVARMLEVNWPIDEIKQRYLKFLEHFREIATLLNHEQEEISPQQAFLLRILLIHHYRRILLKDPSLPLELLPADWPAVNARNLSVNIYKRIFEQADEYFLSIAKTAEGSLPAINSSFYKRFGGLELAATL